MRNPLFSARAIVNGARALALALMALAPAQAVRADCLPIAGLPGLFTPASLTLAAAPAAGSVRLTFLGHSSFLIESAGGVTAVTDYNGVFRPPMLPDIVTMNNAHSTHYTEFPDPGIAHVLRGWETGGMAKHDVEVKDLRVRNVPTNVRDYGGTRVAGNSIFVFETASLCIAHLGHLHHDLTDLHLGELGLIDVLLVPADGSFTTSHETMLKVIDQIKPSVIIPMHWFSQSRLAQFLARLEGTYTVRTLGTADVTLSRATLPHRTVLVLPGDH